MSVTGSFAGIIQVYDHEKRTGTTTLQQKRSDSVSTLFHSFRFLSNFKMSLNVIAPVNHAF